MKKIIMVLVSGVIYTSLITGNATAQRATDVSFTTPKTDIKTASAESDKTSVSSSVDPVNKTAIKEMETNLKAAKVNLKVTSHLSKNFKNVSNLMWNSEEKAIVATFKMNDKSSRVVYSKKGNWLYTIITYHEEQMPPDIRSMVKDNYGGFTIALVQEINQGDATVYMVHLEDSTSLKKILVYNDEITVYESFTKSK